MENKSLMPRGVAVLSAGTERRGSDKTRVQRRMPFFEVVGLSIGVASSETVRARSTIAIDNRRQVTNAAMGVSRPSEGRCLSCWNDFVECPGHLGYMETAPYVHPLAVGVVAQLMTLVCHQCHTPRVNAGVVQIATAADLLPETVFAGTLRALRSRGGGRAPPVGGVSTRIRHLVEFVRRSASCTSCGAPVFVAEVRGGYDVVLLVDGTAVPLAPPYMRYVLGCVLTDEVYWLCGLDPVGFPPFHFVCSTLTVSPPNTRPSDLEHNRSDNLSKVCCHFEKPLLF